MAKWQYTRAESWRYPSLGFAATFGDVLEADFAPDANWDEVDGGTAATLPPVDTSNFTEPAAGTIPVYNAVTNRAEYKTLAELELLTQTEQDARYARVSRERVNVMNYVADPNSVSDWGAVIRAAIADRPGQEYILPEGELALSSPLLYDGGALGFHRYFFQPGTGSRITGRGMGATTLKIADATEADYGIYVVDLENVDDVEVSRLTIDGNQANRTNNTDDALIEINPNAADTSDKSRRVFLNHLRLINSKAEGIDADGGADVFMHNVIMEDNDGLGAHFRGTGNYDVTVSDCLFRNNAHVRYLEPPNAESASGLDYLGTGRLNVANSKFEDNVRGLILHGATRGVISGCVFVANQYQNGIWVRGDSSTAVSDLLLAGNVIDAGIAGILIESGRNVVIQGGIIILNGSTVPTTDGIKASGYTQLTIDGVRFRRAGGSTQDAVDLSSPTGSALPSVRVFVDDIHTGVRLNGAPARVYGSTIAALTYGVRVEGTQTGTQIVNNPYIYGGTRGVDIPSGAAVSNSVTAFNSLAGTTPYQNAGSGSGNTKASNMENGAFVA